MVPRVWLGRFWGACRNETWTAILSLLLLVLHLSCLNVKHHNLGSGNCSCIAHALQNAQLMSLSFVVEGCTSAFDVVFLSVLADLAKTTTERVTCFSVLYGMGALGHAIAICLSAGILRWELQNYALVWLSMSIAMASVMILVLLCIPETLPSAQAKSRPQKLTLPRLMTSTAVQMRYLVSNRFLQIWLTAVFIKSLAAGLGGQVLQWYSFSIPLTIFGAKWVDRISEACSSYSFDWTSFMYIIKGFVLNR